MLPSCQSFFPNLLYPDVTTPHARFAHTSVHPAQSNAGVLDASKLALDKSRAAVEAKSRDTFELVKSKLEESKQKSGGAVTGVVAAGGAGAGAPGAGMLHGPGADGGGGDGSHAPPQRPQPAPLPGASGGEHQHQHQHQHQQHHYDDDGFGAFGGGGGGGSGEGSGVGGPGDLLAHLPPSPSGTNGAHSSAALTASGSAAVGGSVASGTAGGGAAGVAAAEEEDEAVDLAELLAVAPRFPGALSDDGPGSGGDSGGSGVLFLQVKHQHATPTLPQTCPKLAFSK